MTVRTFRVWRLGTVSIFIVVLYSASIVQLIAYSSQCPLWTNITISHIVATCDFSNIYIWWFFNPLGETNNRNSRKESITPIIIYFIPEMIVTVYWFLKLTDTSNYEYIRFVNKYEVKVLVQIVNLLPTSFNLVLIKELLRRFSSIMLFSYKNSVTAIIVVGNTNYFCRSKLKNYIDHSWRIQQWKSK